MAHLLCFYISSSDFVCLQETDKKLFHTTGEREWSLVTGVLAVECAKHLLSTQPIFI